MARRPSRDIARLSLGSLSLSLPPPSQHSRRHQNFCARPASPPALSDVQGSKVFWRAHHLPLSPTPHHATPPAAPPASPTSPQKKRGEPAAGCTAETEQATPSLCHPSTFESPALARLPSPHSPLVRRGQAQRRLRANPPPPYQHIRPQRTYARPAGRAARACGASPSHTQRAAASETEAAALPPLRAGPLMREPGARIWRRAGSGWCAAPRPSANPWGEHWRPTNGVGAEGHNECPMMLCVPSGRACAGGPLGPEPRARVHWSSNQNVRKETHKPKQACSPRLARRVCPSWLPTRKGM